MIRGCLRLRPSTLRSSSVGLRPSNLLRQLQIVESHLRCTFTTSSSQLAAKKVRVPQNIPKPASNTALPYKSAFNAYTEQLASKASPTLLYEAPSHAFYKTGWIVLGGFCLTWAVINWNNHYMHPLEGTPAYVSIIVGTACVAMVAGAGWCFLKVSPFSSHERAYADQLSSLGEYFEP